MAGNSITYTLAGDSTSLERTFANVGSSATRMAGDLDKADGKARGLGSAMDSVGGAVGNQESKFMGAADLLDGLGGAFGLPTEGATGLFRAFGDLSGGFEIVQGVLGQVGGALSTLAGKIGLTSAAQAVWNGIQAAFNAIMAVNPVVLVTIALVALGAAIVVAYQKSETFRNIVQGAFNTVRGAAEAFWGFLSGLGQKIWGIAGTVKDALIWPYKTAFNLIAKAWNNTVGKIGFELPSWVPGGIGGKGFHFPQIPELHTGGIIPGVPGSEVPIMALAGEEVRPLAAASGSGNVTIVVQGSVITERDLGRIVADALRQNKLIGVT